MTRVETPTLLNERLEQLAKAVSEPVDLSNVTFSELQALVARDVVYYRLAKKDELWLPMIARYGLEEAYQKQLTTKERKPARHVVKKAYQRAMKYLKGLDLPKLLKQAEERPLMRELMLQESIWEAKLSVYGLLDEYRENVQLGLERPAYQAIINAYQTAQNELSKNSIINYGRVLKNNYFYALAVLSYAASMGSIPVDELGDELPDNEEFMLRAIKYHRVPLSQASLRLRGDRRFLQSIKRTIEAVA